MLPKAGNSDLRVECSRAIEAKTVLFLGMLLSLPPATMTRVIMIQRGGKGQLFGYFKAVGEQHDRGLAETVSLGDELRTPCAARD